MFSQMIQSHYLNYTLRSGIINVGREYEDVYSLNQMFTLTIQKNMLTQTKPFLLWDSQNLLFANCTNNGQ